MGVSVIRSLFALFAYTLIRRTNMFRIAIVTTFIWALSSIATSLVANDASSLTAITSILMATCATELALYFGE